MAKQVKKNEMVRQAPLPTTIPIDDPLKKADKTLVDTWIEQSVLCDYVQYRTKPVPTKKGNEPVWEMRINTRDHRYKVDAIHYNLEVLIFEIDGQRQLVPSENVAHAHPIA